jgi:hypothetical protein
MGTQREASFLDRPPLGEPEGYTGPRGAPEAGCHARGGPPALQLQETPVGAALPGAGRECEKGAWRVLGSSAWPGHSSVAWCRSSLGNRVIRRL